MSEGARSSPVKSLIPGNVLITPSASPSGSRFCFSSPVPSIRDSAPPPAKKRRFASTASSSSFSVSTPRSSSSSRIDPVYDLHRARRASSLRVLDIWSSLAARYNRRLDEDDIIDIRTGDVIKDRGVLRELPQQFEIGHFADADDPLNSLDASSEGDGAHTEADDDVDEIDAFAPENEELRLESKAVPPVQVMDPADAGDLREFMEAERLRRELDGEEESEDDFDVPVDSELDAFSIYDSSDPPAHDSNTTLNQQEASRGSKAAVDDDDSEDEFAAWNIDEGNTIYRVVSEPELDIEGDKPVLSSPPLAPVLLPSSPSSPTLTKRPPRENRVSVSPKQKPAPPERAKRRDTSSSQAQLQTPPRSTSSAPDSSLDDIDVRFPPPQIRARSKSVKSKGPNKTPASQTNSHSDSASPHNTIKSKTTTKSKPKLIPVVVIPRISTRAWQGSSQGNSLDRLEHNKTVEKGQAVQKLTDSENGPSTSRERDRLPKPRRKSVRLEGRTSNESDSSPVRHYKRKRIPSSSGEDVSDNNRENLPQASDNDGNAITDESSEDSGTDRKQHSTTRSKHRAQSARLNTSQNSYPYNNIPYTPQHEHATPYPPPTFQPIQDPNAQFIIAQAMHQLAYLMTGPQPSVTGPMGWSSSPTQSIPGPPYHLFPPSYQQQQWPFTHPHHQRPDMGSSTKYAEHSSSNYNTPTHHSNPYRYAPTPSLSKGTQPPSSPVEYSSPVKGKSKGRSKSRSRKVSFQLNPSSSPPGNSKSKGKSKSSHGQERSDDNRDSKGKTKALALDLSEEEDNLRDDDVQIISSPSKPPRKSDRKDCRKKAVGRGQTPGPPATRDKMGR